MKLQCNRLKFVIIGAIGVLAIWLCCTYAPVTAKAYSTDSTDGRVAYTANQYGEDRKVFYNVQDAINDGYNSGRYVYMCSDWCLNETLGIADSKKIVIYMFGHKITNNCNSTVIRLYEHASLYLIGDTYNDNWSKINMSYTGRSSGISYCSEYWNTEAKTLTCGLVTGGVGHGDKAGGVWMEDYSYLYLKRVSIAGNVNIGQANHGGGVSMEYGCQLVMHNNSRIQDNYAYYGGGVGATDQNNHIYLNSASSIDGNTAWEGGGVYAAKGGTRIHLEWNSNISNNCASSGGGVLFEEGWNSISSDDKSGYLGFNRADGGYGGAVNLNTCYSDCGFYGVTFSRNSAKGNGGALYLKDRDHFTSWGAYVTLKDCKVTDNQCGTWGDGEGGGVYVDPSVDIKLEGQVTVKDNARHDGLSDDLFLGDKLELFVRYHAYILGGASEGSEVRVRTGMTKDQRIGKNIDTYADGIYTMNVNSYWITKGDDCDGDLWQRC